MLIAMSHAGAGASVFVPWSDRYAGRLLVRGVRPPGRESRLLEPPHESLNSMAGEIVTALLDERVSPATVLYGHCLGAWVMFEVARRLREDDYSLSALVVSSQAPPRPAAGSIGKTDRPDPEDFWAEVQALGGVPDEILDDPELKELVEPALRADFRIAREAPGFAEPLDVPIHAVWGEEDEVISMAEVTSWSDWSTTGFRLHRIGGDHFLLDGASFEVLGELLFAIASGADR